MSVIHDRVTKARQLLLGVCSLLQDNEDEVSVDDIEAALTDAEAAVEELEAAWNAMEQETQR